MIDINNYSYTRDFLKEKENIIADYETPDGYGKITIEQWGSNKNNLEMVVYICIYAGEDIAENFTFNKKDYSSRQKARENAARLYNRYAPEPIPLF